MDSDQTPKPRINLGTRRLSLVGRKTWSAGRVKIKHSAVFLPTVTAQSGAQRFAAQKALHEAKRRAR